MANRYQSLIDKDKEENGGDSVDITPVKSTSSGRYSGLVDAYKEQGLTVDNMQPENRLQSITSGIQDASANAARRVGRTTSLAAQSVEDLARGDMSFRDVKREVPDATNKVIGGVLDTFIPGAYQFAKNTLGIFGEGLAYAIDPMVREQYSEGYIDILPTITNNTPKDVLKYTIAAGIEVAIISKIPDVTGMSWKKRLGIGGLEGMGFAVSEGIAKDRSVEEIIDSMDEYGVSGAALAYISPVLTPLLRSELNNLPKASKEGFRALYEEINPPAPRYIFPTSSTLDPTPIPISTPNSRREAFLRSRGYEPYIPEEQMPSIDAGNGPVREPSNLPTVDPAQTPPNVFDGAETYSRYAGYEGYTPDGELPTVGQTPRQARPDYTEVVPEDQPNVPPPGGAGETLQRQTVTDAVEDFVESPETQQIPVRSETDTSARAENEVPVQTSAERNQSDMMPVGDGEVRVSRLAQRLEQDLMSMNPRRQNELGITYNRANNRAQVRQAAQIAVQEPARAMRIAAGIESQPGLLNNAMVMALKRIAIDTGDASLLVRLSDAVSLRATRMGQEISVLNDTTDLTNDPLDAIQTISRTRKAKFGASSDETSQAGILDGQEANRISKYNEAKDKTVKELDSTIRNAQLKKDEAEKVIRDIIC